MRRHNFRYQRDEIYVHLYVCADKFLACPSQGCLHCMFIQRLLQSSDCGEHDVGTRRVAPGTSG
jgi:hypothetical protein